MSIKPFAEVDSITANLQGGNGAGKFAEIGTQGLQAWAGYLRQAYHAELRWPEVFPMFDRVRRSDPEIAIARVIFSTLGRSVTFDWQMPDDPNAADKKAFEWASTVFNDIEGGIEDWRDALLSYVPFMGWGWWEVLPGIRSKSWRAPGNDEWRSKYDDGKIGIRRLAWRDHSSFYKWEMDDKSGRLYGMWQLDPPNPTVLLPLDRSLHITFGDAVSPEGLSPLEAVWRLERIKYGLELVQGIGFEHSAGYLNVSSEKTQLTESDHDAIRRAARAIMSVQEGNYAAWPKGLTGELKDVNFSAASAILETIRYYGLLKLQVYAMAWVAIASTAGTGAYSAVQDVSGMFIQIFNAMIEGFAGQLDRQVGERLFMWNSFPGITQRPKIVATPIEKNLGLSELASFMQMFAKYFVIGDEDVIALRRRSGFLPEVLPEEGESAVVEQPDSGDDDDATPPTTDDGEGDTDEPKETTGDEPVETEMASNKFVPPAGDNPLDVTYAAVIDPKDVKSAVNKLKRWAKTNDPDLYEWLTAAQPRSKEV